MSALICTQRAIRASNSSDNRSSPVKKWYFAISPLPQRCSRAGSVSSMAVSHTTPVGCQKAPTKFLPAARLTPVLPPMAASIMPTNVVETCTTRMPRCHDAAAKPAMSVTIPPPTPTTKSLRVSPAAANSSANRSIVAKVLCASPSPTTCRDTATAAGRCGATSNGRCACVTIATRRTSAGINVASSDTAPRPTITS